MSTVSNDSIHEASHAIVAAFLGVERISIIVHSENVRCSSEHGTLSAQIITSCAGYAADLLISNLPEMVCRLRSRTDRELRETMRTHIKPNIDWDALCLETEDYAKGLVLQLSSEILNFAYILEDYLNRKVGLPAEVVQAMECVKRARSLGCQRHHQQSATEVDTTSADPYRL